MASTLADMFVAACNRPDPKPYLFEIGQTVRVKKGCSDDGQTPAHWEGAICTVVSRHTTLLHKDHWYKVYNAELNLICDFREDELDLRYCRAS